MASPASGTNFRIKKGDDPGYTEGVSLGPLNGIDARGDQVPGPERFPVACVLFTNAHPRDMPPEVRLSMCGAVW